MTDADPPRPATRQYTRNPPLREADVNAEPLRQFEHWLEEARAAEMLEPTAMALATVDADGRPSVRIVLFKGLYGAGLGFFTHYDSRKARALAARPFAAATFWWDRLERSVRFEGRVEKLAPADSAAYFHTRPRGSQLGAATSHQSRVVDDRGVLERRLGEHERKWQGQDVPCPADWGGYRLLPDVIEFWQGRRDRLHDRLRYTRTAAGWTLERLEP